jgi:hypothetical protein
LDQPFWGRNKERAASSGGPNSTPLRKIKLVLRDVAKIGEEANLRAAARQASRGRGELVISGPYEYAASTGGAFRALRAVPACKPLAENSLPCAHACAPAKKVLKLPPVFFV